MSDESSKTTTNTDSTEKQAGYLVLKLKIGQGFHIGDSEIRIGTINGRNDGNVSIAIRAPKDVQIRKLK